LTNFLVTDQSRRSTDHLLQSSLEAREAEVARLSEPRTREQLTEQQLRKLSQQESELAELRQKLGAAGPPSEHPWENPPEADEGQPVDGRGRHHIIDLPPEVAATCR
jgi:hypothetical protein